MIVLSNNVKLTRVVKHQNYKGKKMYLIANIHISYFLVGKSYKLGRYTKYLLRPVVAQGYKV